MIAACERIFVADKQRKALAVVGEVAEDPGVLMRRMEDVVAFFHFVVAVDRVEFEQGALDAREPVEAPVGGGHGFDGMEFGDALGLEVGEIGVEQVLILRRGFVWQYDVLRAEAVAECVHVSRHVEG